ncbi:uncharacterized protein LOC106179062 [Lingula anatina]|uniref:Uncharacterized protein LOC106179062 n=1 Tax=Lingula anatina TaxID=7574 RepID=A0A1S3K5W3_LINAN|nr:uncharacterized protein LOC106179062 [Lingula anatina]|eukprot:XP_013418020.1 uncharacterized protein LOC106179062 [Lingula anatina]
MLSIQIQVILSIGVYWAGATLPPIDVSSFPPGLDIGLLESCQLDLCFAIDASESLTQQGFDNERFFAQQVVRRIASFGKDVSARYAAVVFSTNVTLVFDFTVEQTTASIVASLEELPYFQGRTNIPDAMNACGIILSAESFGGRPTGSVLKTALILTDGVANEGSSTIQAAAKNMRSLGVRSIAIGAGPGVNRSQLYEIAQNDFRFVFQVEDTESLGDIVDSIGLAACNVVPSTTSAPTPPPTTAAPSTTTPTTTTTAPPTKPPSTTTLPPTEPLTTTSPTEPPTKTEPAIPSTSVPCLWSGWSSCDAPCGGGIQRRTKDCCSCSPRIEIRSCNHELTVDGARGPVMAHVPSVVATTDREYVRARAAIPHQPEMVPHVLDPQRNYPAVTYRFAQCMVSGVIGVAGQLAA